MNNSPQQGFGAVLRQRREELGLTLHDMAVRTRVHKTHLQALEEENLRQLPGTAYAVGFLRIYARELGLSVTPLLAGLQRGEAGEEHADTSATRSSYRQRVRSGRRKGVNSRLLLCLCLLGLILAGYFYWRSGRPTSAPPPARPSATEQASRPSTKPGVAERQHVAPLAASSQPPAGSPSPAPGSGQEPTSGAAIEFPAIPAGGAVVRMIPVAQGTLKVSLDSQEVREYQLQPDQALNWKVNSSLACELSAPNLVRLWVGDDELAIAEHTKFALLRGEQPVKLP